MRTIPLSMTALGAMAISAALHAQQGSGPALTIAQSAEYGEYVADSEGRALYMFTADEVGRGANDAKSNCQDDCAEAWPPYTVERLPEVAGQLDQALVGNIEREDGTMQVTYGGWPLYYFVRDQGHGDVAGQDVEGFGGEWYLVSPDGSINDSDHED